MSEIRTCSIQLARNVGKKIWLENKGNLFWIVFDLGLESFARPSTGSGSPELVLLLPGESCCKNARGFIGRGLCLTSTKREQTNVTVPGSEHTVKAWPTLYNCAFSMVSRRRCQPSNMQRLLSFDLIRSAQPARKTGTFCWKPTPSAGLAFRLFAAQETAGFKLVKFLDKMVFLSLSVH